MEHLRVHRRELPERAVPWAALVKDLQLFEECSGQLDRAVPLLAIEEVRLQSTPDRRNCRVVVAISRMVPVRDEQRCPEMVPGRLGALGEAPPREVGAVVGIDGGHLCRYTDG